MGKVLSMPSGLVGADGRPIGTAAPKQMKPTVIMNPSGFKIELVLGGRVPLLVFNFEADVPDQPVVVGWEGGLAGVAVDGVPVRALQFALQLEPAKGFMEAIKTLLEQAAAGAAGPGPAPALEEKPNE